MKPISIIIPVYNSESYIGRCLDRILTKANSDLFEIIAIDDGSTDQTPVILQKYAEEYDFVTVLTQPNMKQSAARNNGLRHATGTYVMFMDSDDYAEEDMLATMHNLIEREQSDLCICGIRKVFLNRTELETRSCLMDSQDYLADFLTKHQEMDVGLWNKVFLRSIIEEHQLVFENGNFFEDTLFVFKYLCHIQKGISFIEKPLYNLVKREESTTTTYNPEIEFYASALYQKMKEYLSENQLVRYEDELSVLEVRNIIHIIHHNIKFNKNHITKIKSLLSDINYNLLFRLPTKYRIALLLLKLNPVFYEKMYTYKKST
ncbi:glycosyltransferase family 2 protein [Ectobacillus sp. sgz5001026]|uniref:glycosyltransferase family 2 protein n=1 Tax=Ectobacillus sp. sgz5001026 TaxID=3242473 RepID=UPI0036D3DD5C